MSAAFTHDGPGTSASEWAGCEQWHDVAPLVLLDADGRALERLVVLAAHPDDESLGAGGLSHVAARHGLTVQVVVATDGERSHPRSPTHPPGALAARRRQESAVAAQEVAPAARLSHLGRPDGALAADVPGLVADLVAVVGDGRGVLLVGPWTADGHPDHDAAGAACRVVAARTGCRVLGYPIWSWHHRVAGGLPWADVRRLPLDEEARTAKRRAVAAHASQVAPLSAQPGDETLLTPGFLAHFAGDETFVEQTAADEGLEELHRELEEPWEVAERWYEQRKRALLLAALPRRRYRRTWEVGCSTGVLAADLATRSDETIGTDTSATALRRARARAGSRSQLRFVQHDAGAPWGEDLPAGGFDLVVVSEVGYFLSPGALDALAGEVLASAPYADVVLCHWRHPVVGWPLDGPRVHARLGALLRAAGLVLLAEYRDRDVELLVLGPAASRIEPRS